MYADLSEPPVLAGTGARCPGCDSRFATWVTAGAQPNLLCLTCGACWHASAGQWQRVSMRDCPGCDYQAVCLAAQ